MLAICVHLEKYTDIQVWYYWPMYLSGYTCNSIPTKVRSNGKKYNQEKNTVPNCIYNFGIACQP